MSNWSLHRQPKDQIADHEYSIWRDDEPLVLANVMPGNDCALEEIVRAVNAHATLVAALENARSIVRAFTGDLLAVPKSQSDAGYVDSVAWTVQQEIEAALHLAKHGSSQVEQPQ